MLLYEVSSDDFILVASDSDTERVHGFIRELEPGHVIISSENKYYLLTAEKATELLDSGQSVQKLIHKLNVTPAMDAFINADYAPDQCVVTDGDEVVGFFDVTGALSFGKQRSKISYIPDDDKITSHSLCADFPEKLGAGQTVSLMVYLSKDFEDEDELGVSLQIGETVDVVIQARDGLTLEGSGEGRLTVSDEDESPPLRFKLTGKKQGTARVYISAFCKDQFLGKISLSPIITEAENVVDGEYSQKLAAVYPKQADLTLLIDENGDKLNFKLYASDPDLGYHYTKFGPVHMKRDSIHYFQKFFKDIDKLPLKTSKQREIAEFSLERKGCLLFEQLIPDDLKSVLWSLKEHIQSVQIMSEESWIPWELCKLQGNKGDEIIEGPFFCEAFALTRSFYVSRIPRLNLKNIGLVIPKDSRLKMARDEKAFIESLADKTRKVIPIQAETQSVAKAMQSGKYDCLHFSGHGVASHSEPNHSQIILENKEVLSPEFISGVITNLRKANPLVFLNACQTGQGALSLTHVGGWAARFIKAGAAAFIGTYWSVYDKSAFEFSKVFYEGLLNGLPIGKAVQEARLSIRENGDPTWLAYTVFGDPVAEVEK